MLCSCDDLITGRDGRAVSYEMKNVAEKGHSSLYCEGASTIYLELSFEVEFEVKFEGSGLKQRRFNILLG